MDMDQKCTDCVNVLTPICNGCRTTEKANGIVTKSAFCRDDKSLPALISDLAAVIENRAKERLPLSIRIVLKYNDLLQENYNDGKKENISTS